MSTMKLDIETAKQIISEWAMKLPVRANVYLFGSQIKGSTNEHSDVDIAVEFPEFKSITDRTLFERQP